MGGWVRGQGEPVSCCGGSRAMTAKEEKMHGAGIYWDLIIQA